MRYYFPFKTNDCVYSIDKLIVIGKFLYNSFDSFQTSLNSLIMKYSFVDSAPCDLVLLNNSFYLSKRKLTYLNNFRFELAFPCWSKGESFSFWLGTHFQNFDKVIDTWKLEINPNKCMPCEFVSALFNLLKLHSKSFNITEYDIAIDIPISRENLFLVKDNRKYALYQNSEFDKTEYLGTRHFEGFCKLYNKQLEQKLSFPLTRFEITCTSFDVESILHKIPTIYILKNQLEFIDFKLTGTDMFIIKTLLFSPSRIVELERKKRSKIEKALNFCVSTFQFDSVAFYNLLFNLKDLSSFFEFDYTRSSSI